MGVGPGASRSGAGANTVPPPRPELRPRRQRPFFAVRDDPPGGPHPRRRSQHHAAHPVELRPPSPVRLHTV
ncbi:hypothetical protein HanRHA438_Chr03g0137381 [Helianthus annuus]|nr:hypothetical protein HanRHA438_Chr03g0137381 [Helianthus annuus]